MHMKARGLHDGMYFGFAWDGESDAALPGVLGMVAPGVPWASGSHGYTLPPRYTAQSQIYGAAFTAKNLKGWKRSDVYVLNPRGGGTVLGLGGTSSPALFRILPGRALTAGCNGVGRMAADYWEGMYFLGCSASQYLIPGMGLNSWLLWPGPQGAQPSQRFEAMREGIMECEARIFIEQALERGYLEPELAQKAQEVLTANEQELYFIPVSMSNAFACYFSGYQQRMARLFQTAAQVADAMGSGHQPVRRHRHDPRPRQQPGPPAPAELVGQAAAVAGPGRPAVDRAQDRLRQPGGLGRPGGDLGRHET